MRCVGSSSVVVAAGGMLRSCGIAVFVMWLLAATLVQVYTSRWPRAMSHAASSHKT
jgi:hypothetical protein